MAELPEDDRALAAEYALGLLEGAEADTAAARTQEDAAFAAEVRRWQEDMAGLATTLEPVDPGAGVRRALMARLFGKPARRGRWGLGALAGAMIGAAAFFVVIEPDRFDPRDRPVYTAVLQVEDGALNVRALFDPAQGVLALARLQGAPAAPGRSTELWAIAEGRAPVSLGLVPPDPVWQAVLPEELRARPAGLVLALSDEPSGGSPTGQPTGAVLATAPLQRAAAD